MFIFITVSVSRLAIADWQILKISVSATSGMANKVSGLENSRLTEKLSRTQLCLYYNTLLYIFCCLFYIYILNYEYTLYL